MKATRNTAIVKFSKEDIEAAGKTKSGLFVPFGKWISDKDLYYTPQRCTIQSIVNNKFFKEGDTVYIDFAVFLKGRGIQKEESRMISDNGEELYYCYGEEIYVKIEDGKIMPKPNILLCTKEKPKPRSEIIALIDDASKEDKEPFKAIIDFIHNDTSEELGLKAGDKILCDKVADFNMNRVEGTFYFFIEAADVLAKIIE